MIQIKAVLNSIYKSNDFVNKDTQEVTKGKHYLQLLFVKRMRDGSEKQELLNITIPFEKLHLYKDKVGKEVVVDVGLISKDYIFYGI